MNLSVKSSLAAHSVTDISSARRAIKVRLFRNGDKYYKGLLFPIAFIRFKDLNNLFKALGTSVFCDQKVLPHGIRHLFDLNGKKIKCLSDLKDGGNYVCSSNNTFIPMDYLGETMNPIWKTSSQKVGDVCVPLRPFVLRDTNTTPLLTQNSNGTKKQKTADQRQNSYRTIVVVKNGAARPRKMYRWTFSLQPLPQFNALMSELCNLLDVNSISHLCTVERNKITSISEIMKVDTVFFAFPESIVDETDFLLTNQELTLINFMKEAKYKDVVPKTGAQNTESKVRCTFNLPNKNYEVGPKIASGKFSSVRECFKKDTNELVALKRIELKSCKEKEEQVKKERDILKRLSHPNIIKLLDSYETQDSLYLVLEYISNSDLITTIIESKYYSEQDIGGVIHNLVSALQYIHSANIVHRDIKIENVLVQKSKAGLRKLKLCDFGLATEVRKNERLQTVCGTPLYMAPEVVLQKGYATKVDLWGVGVFLHILVTGTPPFHSPTNDINEIFEMIVKGKYDKTPEKWRNISEDVKKLIASLLQEKEEKRPTAADVLQLPWVSSDKVASKYNLRYVVGSSLMELFRGSSYLQQQGNNMLAKSCLDKDSNFFETVDAH